MLLASMMLETGSPVFAFSGSDDGSAKAQEKFVVLGQVVYPGKHRFNDTKYDWNDLRGFGAAMFENDTGSVTSNELCDIVTRRTDAALALVETKSNLVAHEMSDVYPESDDTALLLSEIMIDKSKEGFFELKRRLPSRFKEILEIKRLTMESLAMILIHDAALEGCPMHAAKEQYHPIIATTE